MTEEESELTYNLGLLEESYVAWERSEGLRFIYGDLYAEVRRHCIAGPTLEIGSGIGVSKAYFKDLVTSDVVKTPYVDRAMSAYTIEAEEGDGWGNIFAIDVLHHLMYPLDFFESAVRALQPGGRLILVEPAATVGGRLFYSLFHHEPILPKFITPPFKFEPNGDDGEFANMGMGVGLFLRHRDALDNRLSRWGLRCQEVCFRDLLAYPLTGGYSKPQMLPTAALRILMKFEKWLPQSVYKFLGLRMVIVLEKDN